MMTEDNNGELFCAVIPLVTTCSSDIRRCFFVFLAKMYPPILNGLLNIDLATLKRRTDLLSYLESSTPVSRSFQSGLERDRESSSLHPCVQLI